MANLRLLVSLLVLMSLRPNDAPGQPSAAGDGDAGPWCGRWTLIRLVLDGAEWPLRDSGATLRLAPGGGMDGRAAVNDYQGRYAADAVGSLRWLTPTRATRLGGPAERLKIEAAYLRALSMASHWEILSAGNELRLETADGSTVLAFRRQADPPAPSP